MKPPPAFIIANAHDVFRRGLLNLFKQNFTGCTITQVTDANSLLQAVEQQPHDVVLIDADLPPGNGFTAAYNIIQLHAACRIMMFAYERSNDVVIEAFARGATAFFYGNDPEEDIIYKTTEMLKSGYCITQDTVQAYREALQRIALRQNPLNPLTGCEKVVLQYIVKGLHNPEIAALLCRSVKTIDNHRNSIMHKAGCHNIVELMAHVRKMGWI